MSQENVEIVRSLYEAVNCDDWDAAFRDMSPDIELTTPPGPTAGGPYRGREDCQGYLQELLTAFDPWSAEPEEFFESGDQVAVVLKVRARPKGSSAEIAIRIGHLWAFRDGRALSLRIFPEPEKALEAAGLRE